MELRVLAVGDVVGTPGLQCLDRHLRQLKQRKQVDFCVVNGENANTIGITPKQAEQIFDAGADVITLGNHTFRRFEIGDYLDDCDRILRPYNLAPSLPGRGFSVFSCKTGNLAVVNLIGRCAMDFTPDNPFLRIEELLKTLEPMPVLLDFHAEATAEKLAMGHMLDGRVSAVWGTHTHVPTADAMILPKGTGYISDLGMTGSSVSVLGIRPEQSINHFLGGMPCRYEPAGGACKLEGVLLTISAETNLCTGIESVSIHD